MAEAPQGAAPAAAVTDVRAVGIALAVGEGVVLAVVGDPRDHRALDRGRAEHREDESNSGGCLERSVGKEAVQADRDTESREEVHDREHDKVGAVKQAVPQLPADDAERDHRADRDQTREEAVEILEGDGLDVLGGRAVLSGAIECGGALHVGALRTLPGGRGALDGIGAHRCARRWKLARQYDVTSRYTISIFPLNDPQDTGWRANAVCQD
jgi:hypothetical protein